MLSRPLYIIICTFLILSCGPNPTKQEKEVVTAIHKTDNRVTPKPVQVPKMKNLDIDYCMGKFEPMSHEDFIAIPIKYADREGMYMRVDAYSAFKKMYEEAKKDGIKFQIR